MYDSHTIHIEFSPTALTGCLFTEDNVFCEAGTQHFDIIQMKFTHQNVVLAAADRQPLIQRFLISLASLYLEAFCKIYYWSDGSIESLDSDETS